MTSRTITGWVLLTFLSGLALGACQGRTPEPTPSATLTTTPTRTASLTPSPTATATPTITPTPAPSDTPAPTPTETMTWDDQGLSLTPIPRFNEIITADNVTRVEPIAVWGNGKANTLALSPDNEILAVGTGIGVYLYESLNFLFITTLPTPYPVQSIAFAPNQLFLALGQAEGRIDIFDLNTLALINRLVVPNVNLSSPHEVGVHFSADGRHLASVITTESSLYINRWETASWRLVTAFTIPNGLAAYINTSANLLGVIDGENLTLQSLAAAQETAVVPLPASEPIEFWETIPILTGQVVPSSDGDFVIANNGISVLRWNLVEETVPFRLDQYPAVLSDPCYQAPNTCRNVRGNFSWICETGTITPPVETIRLTPDNAAVLISLNANRAELRQANTGALMWAIDSHFSEVRFSTRLDFFMGIKADGTIEKRALSDGGLLDTLNLHPSQLAALAFSPDGGVLAVGYSDGWVRVYSAINGDLLGVLDGSATALQFSLDGSLLAAGLADGAVRIFELGEGRYQDLLNGHLAAVTDLAFTSNGSTLLTGSDDCTISTWDIDGRSRRTNRIPGGPDPFQIVSVADANQRQYVLARGNGIFQISDTQTAHLFSPPTTGFADMALSPNGRLLAGAGPSAWFIPIPGVNLLPGPQELAPTISSQAEAIAFTPNGSVFMAASAEGLAFWSVPAGEQLSFLSFPVARSGSDGPIDLTVSPDGSLIGLAKADGLIHIYAVRQANGQ
ncbi:MAG: WD40 repeat domain-containing protein [Brevefilum sp.]